MVIYYQECLFSGANPIYSWLINILRSKNIIEIINMIINMINMIITNYCNL